MNRFEQVVKYQYDNWELGEAVHITAAALLKDSVTYKELIQLKLQNVSKLTVDSAMVVIALLDENGNKIGDEIEYNFTNAAACEGDVFGNKEAIELSVSGTSSFKATVTEAVFKEGFTWKLGDSKDEIYENYRQKVESEIRGKIQKDDFDGAEDQIKSSGELVDAEKLQNEIYDKMISNAKAKIGQSKDYDAALAILDSVPDEADGKVQCVEKAYKGYLENARMKSEEGEPEEVLKILDKVPDGIEGKEEIIGTIPASYLKSASKSVAKGDIEAAESALQKVEGSSPEKDNVLQAIADAKSKKAADAKKRKKIIIAAVIAVVLCIIGFIAYKIMEPQIILNRSYNEAVAMYEEGRYKDAILFFDNLGDYKESKDYYQKCDDKIKEETREMDYIRGVGAFADGDMSKAYANLNDLGDYKDTAYYLEKLEQYRSVLDELKGIQEDYNDKDYGKAKIDKALKVIKESEIKTDELEELESTLKAMKKFLGIYHQDDDNYEIFDGEITLAYYVLRYTDNEDNYSIDTSNYVLTSYDDDDEYWFYFDGKDFDRCYCDYGDNDEDGMWVTKNDNGSLTIEDDYDAYTFKKGKYESDDDGGSVHGSSYRPAVVG